MTNLTDADYYRIGAKRADGWEVKPDGIYGPFGPIGFGLSEKLSKAERDALAFQLRDQINAIEGCWLVEDDSHVAVYDERLGKIKETIRMSSTALDWIKCIVDSGLLGGGE